MSANYSLPVRTPTGNETVGTGDIGSPALGPAPSERPLLFVCGPTAFVEHAADALVALGHPPERIHAERFGPSGS